MTPFLRAVPKISPAWWPTAARAGPRQSAPRHRPVGSRQLGETRLDPCAAAQGRRRGRRQSYQRPDAGVVRPFPEGTEERRRGKPRVDYFVMGANAWKSATSWPLPQTKWTTFYLSGPGGAKTAKVSSYRPRPAPSRRTLTSTTPHSLRRASAVTPAAVRNPARRDRTTSCPSSSGPTYWSTAARHLNTTPR